MRLSPQHRSQLLALIAGHYDKGNFRVFLLTRLDKDIERISGSQRFDEQILDSLGDAERLGWLEAYLDALLTHSNREFVAAVKTIADYHQQPLPWYTCVDRSRAQFVGDIPFVDRKDIRDGVTDLDGSSVRNVLIIKGKLGTGKSYLWNYINYLFDAHGPGTCALIDMDDYQGVHSVSETDLMELILSAFGLSSLTEADTQAQGLARAAKLIGQLRQRLAEQGNPKRVIVVDSLDNGSLSESGFQLLDRLIREVSRSNIPGLRMILMGYEREFVSTGNTHVITEKLLALSEADIARFFMDVAQEVDVEMSPASAEQAARKAMQMADDEETNQLHVQIKVVASSIFEQEAE